MHVPTRFRALLALPLLQAVPPSAPPRYTITDVSGALPGEAFAHVALSDTGFVTGWLLESGASSGFRWTARGGVATRLDPGPLAWADHVGRDVGDDGTVVGMFGTTTGGLSLTSGFRWKSGIAEELLTPLGLRGQPRAINDGGWIVGRAGQQPAGTPGAVMWDPDLTPTFLVGLDDAEDVNQRGDVIGFRRGSTYYTGWLWSAGTAIPLGSLDPQARGDVFPRALDAAGRVVGTSAVRGVDKPFLWKSTGGMTELPGLGFTSSSLPSAPLDMSDGGWIVGYVPGANGIEDVVWAPDGSVHSVDPLVDDIGPGEPWQQMFLTEAVNASGQIVGRAIRAGGRMHFALLTPAPLSATLASPLAAGALATVTVAGGAPGRKTFLAGDFDDGLDRGYRVLPGCDSIGLSLAAPKIAGIAVANGSGTATFQWLVPQSLAGIPIRLQAFQLGGCAVSDVVRATP